MAEIHIDPDAVTSAIATHFPERQAETLAEYNSQLRASNGAGIAASKIWNVCAAGGLNIKQNTDKDKCRSFVEEVANSGTSDFFAVCGKEKNTPGGKCVQDFRNLTVNAQQAEGLAKLYASINSDVVQCNGKARNKTTVFPGPVVRMVPTYLQCSSNIDDNFYEFQFNNMDGNVDKTNHNNFKKGVCKLFNSNFTTKDLYGHKWDICSDITDEKTCEQMDSFVRAANIGYIATWGPAWYTLGNRGYEVTSDSLPYCVLSETIIKGNDGTVLIEHTAFGLDGRVFLAGIQRKGSQEIKAQIRSYIENTMGKENVKSFSCEDNYHTVQLKGRSGSDDLLQCTVNGERVDFFFDDLSEAWGVYDKSGREGMTCATWGGTFTGKRCIGLEDEKTCNTIRDANKELCPECKLITWNEKTKTCNLPSSVTANALRKGLNYTAIVGGAAVSVVITVGTLGTATVPTAVVLTGLAVETLGAGVELVAQAKIDGKADDFFVKVNNCNNQTCAEQLIKEYLQVLSNQQNDLSDAEISAADKTFAILFDKIPNDAQFWQDIKAQGMQGQTLEDNKGEFFDITSWNSEQIWRAVGISLQVIPTLASIGWRVAKHSDRFVSATAKLRSKLQATSKQLDNALGIQKPGKVIKDPKLWKPGEDVADYIDVAALQREFSKIDGEDAAYIADLRARTDVLFAQGTKNNGYGTYWADKNMESEWRYLDALLTDAQANKVVKKNKLLSDAIPAEILETLRQSRHDDVYKIIASDDDLYNAAKNYQHLTTEEKTSFLQRIGDELGKTYFGDGQVKYVAKSMPNQKLGGSYFAPGQSIIINSNYEDQSLDKLVDIIIHETGHAVDEVTPLRGALGSLQDLIPETKKATAVKGAATHVDQYATVSLDNGFGLVEMDIPNMVQTDRELLKIQDVLTDQELMKDAGLKVKYSADRDAYFDRYITIPTERSSFTIMESDGSLMNNVDRIRQQNVQ